MQQVFLPVYLFLCKHTCKYSVYMATTFFYDEYVIVLLSTLVLRCLEFL